MDFGDGFIDGYFATEYGKMHFKHRKGSTHSIIFLHGFAASMKSWLRLSGYLDTDLDVYLLDLLGHGDSDAPDIEYSLSMHCKILGKFIKSEMEDAPILMGHSYGGWLAAYYASRNNVEALILEDSSGLKEFVEERHLLNPEYREHMVKKALSLNPREGVLRSMLHADNRAVQLDEPLLRKINCKCIILWGSGDTTIDPKYAYKFNDYIKNSELFIIDGAKHTPHYSNPQIVAEMMNGFISDYGVVYPVHHLPI